VRYFAALYGVPASTGDDARFHTLAATGTTLFVSSHVMDEAERCDRLLLMCGGRIVADDSPEGMRRATGAGDVEEAFLRLVRDADRTSARP
jgi:ABC-2 type transport system ATP-binding protein